MIRTLLTTTALAVLLASGAVAQTTTTTTTPIPQTSPLTAPAGTTESSILPHTIILAQGYLPLPSDNLASRLIGMQVYSSIGADGEHIGDINDLVVSSTGEIIAAVVGVGGFLGIGEKNVAVDFTDLVLITTADNQKRYVVATTKQALEAAPTFDYDRPAVETTTTTTTTTTTVVPPVEIVTPPVATTPTNTIGTVTPPADVTPTAPTNTVAPEATVNVPPAADNSGTALAPSLAPDRSTLTAIDRSALRAEDLIGTAVYGIDNERVGTIGDFVLSQAGGVDAVIVDVGGFLGVGAKEVALAFETLNFLVDANNKRHLFINVTKDQLQAQPAFNAQAYVANRDLQRMVINP